DREGLTIPQLDVRLGIARRQRGNPEPGQRDAVVEVERAHFRPDVQTNNVTGDGRLDFKPDPKPLENNGPLAPRTRDVRDRELAAGEEAGLLAVVGNQVRLGQTLKVSVLREGLEKPADAFSALK